MEDRGGQDGVGAAVADRGDEVVRTGGAARRDDGNADSLGDRPEQLGVVAGAGAVSVDRGHEQLARAELDEPLGPRDGVEAGPLATALHDDLPPGRLLRGAPARVDRDHDGLPAEAGRAARDERRVGDGRRVQRDLVGARPEDLTHVADAPDAAADRQRDERPPGRPLDDVEQRATTFGCGSDVEEDELVGALCGVALGQRRRVALVDEIDEAGALHDAAVRDVETRDDTVAEHQRTAAAASGGVGVGPGAGQRPLRASSTAFARSCRPSSPLRSGWNWTPSTFPRPTALTNDAPCVVRARVMSAAFGPSGSPAYEWTK